MQKSVREVLKKVRPPGHGYATGCQSSRSNPDYHTMWTGCRCGGAAITRAVPQSPVIGRQWPRIAEQAWRSSRSHSHYQTVWAPRTHLKTSISPAIERSRESNHSSLIWSVRWSYVLTWTDWTCHFQATFQQCLTGRGIN